MFYLYIQIMKTFQRVGLFFIALCLGNTLFSQQAPRYFPIAGLPILGRAFPNTTTYTRLPDSMEMVLRKPLWQLSKNPAGIAVYFTSNSRQLIAKWKTGTNTVFSHVPATLVKGLDLYAFDDGCWYYAGIGNPVQNAQQEWTIIRDMDGRMREYLLYLSNYENLDSLEIGIDSGAILQAPIYNRLAARKPILFYGTSIVQGAAASRPGMAYPAQLERMLQIETINFGFSGNGQLDSVIAYAMAAVDASCYVIDCGPNLSPKLAAERTVPFIHLLKKLKPDIAVLLVENIIYPTARFNRTVAEKVCQTNLAFLTAYKQLQGENISGLYYLPAEGLIGNDGEGTVDGVHLTDLGFYRLACTLSAKIKLILANR